ncbi:MAG: inositol monophosphatase [Actinobacteria bacterium]|nr:inositol monophosphatase [Actinomycetota bacterium]
MDAAEPGARALLALAERLAREAGAVALQGRRAGLRDVATKTTATDMVTEYDRACERIVADGIRAARPDDAIVGEEGARHAGTSPYTWCVDPIDGTTNFLYDLPMWAVSIGISDADGPLAGVVHVPARDETFTAVRGGGAAAHRGELERALVATGFSYDAPSRVRQARRVSRMIDRIRDVRRFGAASIDLCWVACGRLDAYFEENLHPWDVAAADLVVREAGARTGDFSGGPLRPAQVLAAPPAIFDGLAALIRDADSGNN